MRRTKEDALKTRDDLLDKAAEIFASKGVPNTSLEEIAKAADVTRGAVYWHFKNKAEIFDALHERIYKPLAEMIVEDLEKDSPDPIKQLKQLCVQSLHEFENIKRKRDGALLFMFPGNYCGGLENYRDKHKNRKDQSLKLFEKYFERAKRQGMLDRDTDTRVLTKAVCCYIKGIFIEYLNNPEDFNLKRDADKMIDMFFEKL